MTFVNSTYNQIEGKVWHRLETFSIAHPNRAKVLLPLPVAFGYIIKESIKHPLQVIEHLIGIGTNLYSYCSESDSNKAFWINNSIQKHIVSVITNIFWSLVLPLITLIQALGLSIRTYRIPIKTTKIQASKQDLIAFLKEEKVLPSKTYSNGKLVTFASNHKYAKHAYKHFCRKVIESTEVNAGNLHFCDTLETRNLLVTEMNAKTNHFDKTFKVYIANFPPDEAKIREAYRMKWIQYQKDLLNANLENLDSVSFDPKAN